MPTWVASGQLVHGAAALQSAVLGTWCVTSLVSTARRQTASVAQWAHLMIPGLASTPLAARGQPDLGAHAPMYVGKAGNSAW